MLGRVRRNPHIAQPETITSIGMRQLYLIVAIDRASKFAFVEQHQKVTRRTAARFLNRLRPRVPTSQIPLTKPGPQAKIKEMIAQLFHTPSNTLAP
jgi:hypothetical protein